MFRPELKDTGWESAPEVVFEITGENYKESEMLYRRYYEVERRDGSRITLSEPTYDYDIQEKELSTIINDSLMNIIWDSITIKELEKHFSKALTTSEIPIVGIRVELPGDSSWEINTSNSIYGWVFYKNGKNIIKTFRFQIGLDGSFKKC